MRGSVLTQLRQWFSESGKLVTKMFNKITEIVEDRSLFVCVLIDEVESLTAARQAAANVRPWFEW